MRELQYPSYSSTLPPRVSWSAIFAGAIFSFVLMACLVALGMGIGFVSAPAAGDARSLALSLGAGGALWLLVSGIVAFYSGGWIAGRLSSIGKVSDSVIHGLLSWSTATLVFFIMTSVVAGGAAVGLFGSLASAMGVAAYEEGQQGRELQGVPQGRQDIQGELQERVGVTPDEAQRGLQAGSQAAGAFGMFGFLILACEALASAFGARAGTRMIKLTPSEYAPPRRAPEPVGR